MCDASKRVGLTRRRCKRLVEFDSKPDNKNIRVFPFDMINILVGKYPDF